MDREVYLERLAKCRARFQFRVLAYCLMNNHVHLALERGPVALSRTMLALQSFYAQKFNSRHKRVGHLFQGRYKALLVQDERYLFALLRSLPYAKTNQGRRLRQFEGSRAARDPPVDREQGSIVYSCIPRLACSTRQLQIGNCLEVFLTRPLRVELPGAVYHVIARGNGRRHQNNRTECYKEID